tara:strand:+ start:11207 stop:11971 length:765 start_codon:yes stop_codon:yes gene_type:complete
MSVSTKPTYNFQNRTAVVTGAGGGMGKEICLALESYGAQIYAIDLKEKPAEYENKQITYFEEDITNYKFIDTIFDKAYNETGRLDYLANVAGVLLFDQDKSLVDIDMDLYDRVMDINLKASMYMARKAIPLMLKTGSGSMVHFSSVQAYRGDPLPQDAYSQSKAAVLNLSKSIAMQFAKDNIRSNTIVPGMTMTPLQKRWENDNDSKDKMAEYIPLKRLGTPADMADGVLFLLSEASSFITGTELIIDGGILLH